MSVEDKESDTYSKLHCVACSEDTMEVYINHDVGAVFIDIQNPSQAGTLDENDVYASVKLDASKVDKLISALQKLKVVANA